MKLNQTLKKKQNLKTGGFTFNDLTGTQWINGLAAPVVLVGARELLQMNKSRNKKTMSKKSNKSVVGGA